MDSFINPNYRFGCRVVPTVEQVQRADQHLQNLTAKSSPGKNCSADSLFAHHNHFTRLTAFRMALLFALREKTYYTLHSSIDERVDLCVPIEDKAVPGIGGKLPVPICLFSRETLRAYRAHVEALRRRLRSKYLHLTPLGIWSDGVKRMEDVPLLVLAQRSCKLRISGTADWLSELPEDLKIAPDFGRKVMENELRTLGLRSTDIDAVLRHTIQGLSKLTSNSEESMLDWQRRTSTPMNLVAQAYLGEVCFGLSKD